MTLWEGAQFCRGGGGGKEMWGEVLGIPPGCSGTVGLAERTGIPWEAPLPSSDSPIHNSPLSPPQPPPSKPQSRPEFGVNFGAADAGRRQRNAVPT